jgi:pimeloyl-ACP methyl ester carboxylesterase
LLFVAYASIIVYMLSIETDLVYHPTRPDQEWQDKPTTSIQDITLHSQDGALHAWYCPVEKPDAVFLMCHGNAGNLSIRGQSLPTYAKRFRSAFFMFDYPGFGLSDGKPSEKGCYAAADAAYDWLINAKGFKPEQIIIAGESLGGAVAVDLASRRPCSGLILTHTFASLPSVAQRLYSWLPVDLLMVNRFASEDKIDRIHVPVFVAHGESDDIIPFSQAESLYAKVRSAKEFLLRPGKGHFDPRSVGSGQDRQLPRAQRRPSFPVGRRSIELISNTSRTVSISSPAFANRRIARKHDQFQRPSGR